MKYNRLFFFLGYVLFTLLMTSCTSSTDTPVSHDNDTIEEVQNIPDNLLITANASKLVLLSADVRPGWVRGTNRLIHERDSQSACRVSFQLGVQLNMNNQVTVYPDVEIAKQAYKKIEYQDDSVEYCDIGDECLLDVSSTQNTFLLFRENNVIVQLWLSKDQFNEVINYANIMQVQRRM